MLEVLEVEDAGEDADDAVVKVEPPSPLPIIPLEFPPDGEDTVAATDDLDELPGCDVKPAADLLVPANGVGLFRDVDVVRSCGDDTLVDDVESAYLQLDVDGTEDGALP